MAITAFTSTAIIDATTIGTTVLTASSAGIAADAIGLGTTDDVTFNSVGCVDGSFTGSLTSEVGGSYRLFNLGSDADVAAGNSEYLEIKFVANECTIHNYATGTGVVRNLAVQASPEGSGIVLGAALGSVSKLFVAEGVADIVRWQYDGGARLYFRADLEAFDTTVTVGRSTGRYGNVYSVDGSFSGSLTSEVGGSYRLYNLGAEGDIDTEYLETTWDTNDAIIATKSTGAGTQRAMEIDSAKLTLSVNGAAKFRVDSNGINYSYQSLQPSGNSTPLGASARRWATVYGVDGDFSGNMTLSNLPTSDPGVAGRLYTTTGGSLKVSAG